MFFENEEKGGASATENRKKRKDELTTQGISQKRSKEVQYEFDLIVPHGKQFYEMLTTINRVVSVCQFSVINTEGFSGLAVHVMDDSHVCFIIARYSCTINTIDKERTPYFHIQLSNLCSLIQTTTPDCKIRVWRDLNDCNIKLSVYKTNSTQFLQLSTIDNPLFDGMLDNLQYDYTITISLGVLRTVLTLSKSMQEKDGDINFAIFEPENKGSTRVMYFRMYMTTKMAVYKNVMRSVTNWETNSVGSTVISVVEQSGSDDGVDDEYESYKECYNSSFAISYLDKFLGSMKGDVVQLSLSKELPLTLRQHLGTGIESFVSMSLSPKQEE